MIVEAKDLQPGDIVGGRVVANVRQGDGAEAWGVFVHHEAPGSSAYYQSTLPRSLRIEIERPVKRWRIVLETRNEDVVDYWRRRPVGQDALVVSVEEVVS